MYGTRHSEASEATHVQWACGTHAGFHHLLFLMGHSVQRIHANTSEAPPLHPPQHACMHSRCMIHTHHLPLLLTVIADGLPAVLEPDAISILNLRDGVQRLLLI